MNLLIDSEALAENNTAPSSDSPKRRTSSPTAGTKRAASDENTQEQIRSALETELTGSAAPASRTKSAPKGSVPEPEKVISEEEQAQTLSHEPAQDLFAEADETDTEEYDFEDAEEYDFEDAEEYDYEDVEEYDSGDVEEYGGEVAEKDDSGDVEEYGSEAAEKDDSRDAEEHGSEVAEKDDSEVVKEHGSEVAKEDDNIDDYICFNVTQALVEDKAEKYMRMFGMCTCSRCQIDVVALALSNLPAKYVVAKPKDMVPRLSMYEAKYSAAVIAQVMKACQKVIELPHHER